MGFCTLDESSPVAGMFDAPEEMARLPEPLDIPPFLRAMEDWTDDEATDASGEELDDLSDDESEDDALAEQEAARRAAWDEEDYGPAKDRPDYELSSIGEKYEREQVSASHRGAASAWGFAAPTKGASVTEVRTRYLPKEEQAQHDVQGDTDGRLRGADGQLLDTTAASGVGSVDGGGKGRHMFVMTPTGQIRAADGAALTREEKPRDPTLDFDDDEEDQRTGPDVRLAMANHSSLAAIPHFMRTVDPAYEDQLMAGKVAAAGEIKAAGGKLQEVSDASGHYEPTNHMTAQALDRFESMGADLHDTSVKLTGKSLDQPSLYASAREFQKQTDSVKALEAEGVHQGDNAQESNMREQRRRMSGALAGAVSDRRDRARDGKTRLRDAPAERPSDAGYQARKAEQAAWLGDWFPRADAIPDEDAAAPAPAEKYDLGKIPVARYDAAQAEQGWGQIDKGSDGRQDRFVKQGKETHTDDQGRPMATREVDTWRGVARAVAPVAAAAPAPVALPGGMSYLPQDEDGQIDFGDESDDEDVTYHPPGAVVDDGLDGADDELDEPVVDAPAATPARQWPAHVPGLPLALREQVEPEHDYQTTAMLGGRGYQNEQHDASPFRGLGGWSNVADTPGAEVQQVRTRYLDPMEQRRHELQIGADGRFHDAEGKLADTAGARSPSGSDRFDKHIFTMTRGGTVRAADAWAGHTEEPIEGGAEGATRMSFLNHSSLAAEHRKPTQDRDASRTLHAGQVAAAGELRLDQGKVAQITDQSGHYQPDHEHTNQFIDHLGAKGVDFHDTTLSLATAAHGQTLHASMREYQEERRKAALPGAGYSDPAANMVRRRDRMSSDLETAHQARAERSAAGQMRMGGQAVEQTEALMDPRVGVALPKPSMALLGSLPGPKRLAPEAPVAGPSVRAAAQAINQQTSAMPAGRPAATGARGQRSGKVGDMMKLFQGYTD